MTYQPYARLLSRRDPEGVIKQAAFSAIEEDEAVRYLAGAMEPVDPEYTKNTLNEGERIWNQVQKGLQQEAVGAESAYQGSVTKNTHIRAYSDIDLLVLTDKFHTLEPPQVPPNPYKGNPVDDLEEIRFIATKHLRRAFPEATVDSTRAKCVRISGGSLRRDVDVVPANWYNTVRFGETSQSFWRGVQILDSHKKVREIDQPFLHAAWLDHKDNETNGNGKRLIRALKSLKYDSENRCDMSSFDIESLVFRMPSSEMHYQKGEEIQLAKACLRWLMMLEANQTTRDSLEVPDGKRKIFANATSAQLTALRKELGTLLREIEQGLLRSFKKLAEARIKWPDSRQRIF